MLQENGKRIWLSKLTYDEERDYTDPGQADVSSVLRVNPVITVTRLSKLPLSFKLYVALINGCWLRRNLLLASGFFILENCRRVNCHEILIFAVCGNIFILLSWLQTR